MEAKSQLRQISDILNKELFTRKTQFKKIEKRCSLQGSLRTSQTIEMTQKTKAKFMDYK